MRRNGTKALEIEMRVLREADYIIFNNSTIRQCGKNFMVSKSTVHKDMAERLPKINKTLFDMVQEVLKKNLNERHIRGGKATKEKYEGKVKKCCIRRPF